ncbi:conserved hypothetical protein, precursor [Deinococcus proteolyticus MRP]|uniref:DUF4139 domain-containing protein n=1 Tax=Deinococcus proteolyticus (strain ATCC 35074 / DSM 20540 / JCM 6276 / NBRC 101906 / NCIMB 13154 / VKM Ac-1939 / CCM 2703 / MRP) TaxID=693977 RepID=F0RPD5_DEIPM|nr:DUF4139 domain-containing protein [Deinococcus proteolyticus]ADY26478.1 conserved hypothetical protein, precursor [Deinococcus proteolyticus MRP]
MNKPMTVALAAALLLGGAAQAQTRLAAPVPASSTPPSSAAAERTLQADLRLYQDFAEVRQPVTAQGGTLAVVWPQSAWSGLIRDSLDLEGLPYTRAVHATQANWLESMEGREVVLHEDGQAPQTVTLVRSRDVLIRDAQGLYRRVDPTRLAFPELPPESGYGALPVSTFDLTSQASGTGTLSYLTRSLGWTPRYTLRVQGGKPTLEALADVTNGTELNYRVGQTELLAGDVNLNRDYEMYRAVPTAANFAADAQSAPGAGKIAQQGSLNGIYRYALTEAFALPANSTVTLPFMTPAVKDFEAYAGLKRGFSEQSDRGVLNRFYRFKADRALPGGGLTVREDGRVTGQTRVQETAAGQAVDFALGRDPDVSYVRSVKALSRTARSAVFQVTYALENSKKQPVKVEITESLYNDRAEVKAEGAGSGDVRREGSDVNLALTLPAGGKVTRTFTVTLPLQ